jgi:hypothetical protein
VLAAVTLSVLALSRPVSFVWVGVAGAVGLLLLRRHELRDLARRRDVQIGLGSVSVAMLVAVGWYFLVGAKPDLACIDRCQFEPFLTLRLQKAYLQQHRTVRLMHVVADVPWYWRQSLGAVGFNEYVGPWVVELGWTILTAVVVGVGLLFSKVTRVLSVVLLAAVVILLPIVVQFIYFLKTGPFWQGRYNLVLQAGLVILAAAALDGAARRVPELRRLLVPVIVACGVLQFAEFYGSLRRFAVGVNGPLDALHWGHGWVPPVSAVLLLILTVVALSATYGWFVMLARRTRVADVRPG